MRKKPSNPDDPVFAWDAVDPHDQSPDALMFLLAADKAVNSSERRQMLDGLMEGNDRDVRRVLESEVDHGDLLDDDFFWCYMGLAMCQGDRHFWRTISEWGYSLDSEVKLPDDKPDAKGRSLACWGASFVEPERLDWLERIGELNPWKGTHHVGKWKMLSPGEMGMLTGSVEHFDYWFPKWTQHIQQEREKFNQRNKVDVACNIPTCISVMVGMMAWQTMPHSPHNPIPNYPKPQELRRRLDSLFQGLTDTFYGHAQPGQLLAALTTKPPVSAQEKVFSALVKWASERDTNPFEQALELQALKQGDIDWCRALVEQGAPLQRSKEGLSLGQALVTAYLASKPHDDDKVLLQVMRLFTQRAKKEAPELLAELWNRKIHNASNTNESFPEMAAVRGRQWDKTHKLLELGCPLRRDGEEAQLGNVLLLKAAKTERDDSNINKNHTADTVFSAWLDKAKEDSAGEQILDCLWNTPVPTKGGDSTWPEHMVLDVGDNDELLAKLIKHGCPLGRRGNQGRELGFRLLLKVMKGASFDAWDAFRVRALEEGNTSIPEGYLTQKSTTLQDRLNKNPGQAKSAINAAELEARWGGEPQQAKQRPRF